MCLPDCFLAERCFLLKSSSGPHGITLLLRIKFDNNIQRGSLEQTPAGRPLKVKYTPCSIKKEPLYFQLFFITLETGMNTS